MVISGVLSGSAVTRFSFLSRQFNPWQFLQLIGEKEKAIYTERKQSEIDELITDPARKVQSVPEDRVEFSFIPC